MARRRSRRGHHHRHRRRRNLITAFLIAAAVLCVGLWFYSHHKGQAKYIIRSGASYNAGSGYRDVEYNGKHYRYNNRITTILYAGLDSEGELVELKEYTSAPRADSIQLIILDTQNKKMSVIALNRDTMTEIRKYTLDGTDRGLMRDHLGYAYTYGNGGAASCTNLCEAVSLLLYGIPINQFVVTNRSSLEKIAQIIGPVSVTVPNDDLEDLDPDFYEGAQVTIDESNLEFFIRSRDTTVDLSNIGRMERQQAYIDAAMQQFTEKLKAHPSREWEDLEEIGNCMQTSITKSQYLDLVGDLDKVTYSAENHYTPDGEQIVAEDHDEFYPDEDALLQKVIDIFYMEK